jgi:hypothetical protein
MRRYILYIAVSLLAFGIGLFIVFNFHSKPVEPLVSSQPVGISEPEIYGQVFNAETEIPEVEQLNDEEKAAFDVLKPTINKWLRGERIESERQEISDELIREVTGKDKISESEKRFWQETGFEFTPYLIDVDGDKENELAVRNHCAPVGNCLFWLFKKNENGYEILLKTENYVQRFKLRRSKTNNYFDLETTSHGDAWSGGMRIYKFYGKEYILDSCFSYSYLFTDKKGKKHELKKPVLTPLHCC